MLSAARAIQNDTALRRLRLWLAAVSRERWVKVGDLLIAVAAAR